ncbi:hypothetical protein TL16_g00946 [Triparma laevis f. inornata]|uniref:Uncharacterized protein n=1 Tax=Triparma laevis f. inornata TaxID=1714386 RepID=A0A9W7DUG0_9STRA|nr:hypothetical protein TL16_g00946 [Triparma laevis f. inornata]
MEFGQTSLEFSATVFIGGKGAIVKTQSTGAGNVISGFRTTMTRRTTKIGLSAMNSVLSASKKLGSRSGADANANKLFEKICHLFYERFKREDAIDELRKKHFIENIDSTPPLTEGEHELISESTKLVKEVSSQAKRIAGTVDKSVEKYFHRDETGIGWAFSVAKVDVPADTLFVHLWLVDTYAKKAEYKGSVICEHLLVEMRRLLLISEYSLEKSFGLFVDVDPEAVGQRSGRVILPIFLLRKYFQ